MRGLILAGVLALALPAAAQVQVYVPGVRVAVAPPALRAEVRPVQPSPGHIWIGGHWAWRGGAHVWMGGHWALPPGPGYVWEPARWISEGGQWIFTEGHWRMDVVAAPNVVYEPPPAETYVVQTAPPAPIVEVQPAVPFAGAVWLPGYWRWHGDHHIWVGGHYSAPREGHVWEAAHWEHRGNDWHFAAGHWRHR